MICYRFRQQSLIEKNGHQRGGEQAWAAAIGSRWNGGEAAPGVRNAETVLRCGHERHQGVRGAGPRSRASRPIDSMSVIVPISLLTCINDRRIVSSRSAASTSAGVIRPSGPGSIRLTSNPLRSRCRQESSTALCSMAEVTTWVSRSAYAATAPLIARLSDSVAPEVQTISRGSALMRSATWTRACSTASSASRPKLWNRDPGVAARSRARRGKRRRQRTKARAASNVRSGRRTDRTTSSPDATCARR